MCVPAIAELRLQRQLVAHPDEPHDFMRRVLLQIGRQFQRRGGRQIAEADIGEEWPLRQIHLQHHVQHRARRIDRKSAHHPRLQTGDVETERKQSAAEQHVLLEAIATPAADNHLSLQRGKIEFWWTVEQHVDALVGDRGGMRADHPAQRIKRRRARSFVTDAIEPGVLIEARLGHGDAT